MYTANFTKNEWLVVKPNRARPSRISVASHEGQVDIYDAPLTAETEANAYLIAASPDLYAACSVAFAFLSELNDKATEWVASPQVMMTIGDALARARGEETETEASLREYYAKVKGE